jgi:hypothetical protein
MLPIAFALRKAAYPALRAITAGAFVAAILSLICEFLDVDLSQEWVFITSLCVLVAGLFLMGIKAIVNSKSKPKNAILDYILFFGSLCFWVGTVALIMNRLGVNTSDMTDWQKGMTGAIAGVIGLAMLATFFGKKVRDEATDKLLKG